MERKVVGQEDLVIAYRRIDDPDRRLLALMAQLTAEEVEEAIDLLADLIADRGRTPVPDVHPRLAAGTPPHRNPVD